MLLRGAFLFVNFFMTLIFVCLFLVILLQFDLYELLSDEKFTSANPYPGYE